MHGSQVTIKAHGPVVELVFGYPAVGVKYFFSYTHKGYPVIRRASGYCYLMTEDDDQTCRLSRQQK